MSEKLHLIQARNRDRILRALAGMRTFIDYGDGRGWREVGPMVFHAHRRLAKGADGGTARILRVNWRAMERIV